MTPLELEATARIRVKEIKRFYTKIAFYGTASLVTVLFWLMTGGGYFWPLWVMLGWGAGLFYEALSLNIVPKLEVLLPFLSRPWEEKLYQKILIEEKEQKNPASVASETETSVLKDETLRLRTTTPLLPVTEFATSALPSSKKRTTSKKQTVKRPPAPTL